VPFRLLKSILLAILCIWPAILKAQTPPLPATLPEDFFPVLRDILHTALQQSPEMISHNLDLAAQEANRYQTAAQLWPSLGGNVNYAYDQSYLASNTNANTVTKGFFFGLGLNQPVYHWGVLRAAVDIAHLQIKITERQYADAYAQLATTLRSQYLSLIAQKVQLRNARLSLAQTQAAVMVVEDRFKSAAATADELTGAHLQLDDASLSIDQALDSFAHAKRLFALTAGLPELKEDAIPDEIPRPIYSPETVEALLRDFVGGGLYNTFQAQNFDDQIKEDELSYKIAKYRLYPKLDLGLGLSQQNQTNAGANSISQAGVLSESVALTANWSIFDGFATRGAKLAALAGKRQAEHNRQNYLDQTSEQARESERQLMFSARALTIAEQRFKLSEEAWQRAKDNFKLHTLSQAGMDQATAAFYQAQLGIFGARANFLSNWSGYLSLLNVDPIMNNLPARFTSNAK
jgi:outer membrane protein TolC